MCRPPRVLPLDPAGGAVGGGEEHRSVRGQLDAPRRAPQQGDPGGPLQRHDLPADRLLGDVQVVRRPGEAAPPSHRGEGAQLAELEAGAGRHTRDSAPFPPGSDKPCLFLNNKLRLFIWASRQ